MIRRLAGAILILAGALLLGLPLVGLIRPADFRPSFAEETLPYDAALALLDAAYGRDGASGPFLERAVAIYDVATVYEWPHERARVAPTDNWILWAAAWADPLLRRAGLTDLDDLFSVYQSVLYERALGRGFGICSQNALGLVDLLDRRYRIEAHLVELHGHVVAEATLPTGERWLLDPSIGVTLPFGIDRAAEEMTAIRAAYAPTPHAALAATYDEAGNVRLAEAGTKPFRPKLHAIERASDVAKWAVPAVMIAVGVLLWPWRRRR
jgi:hypothetical protein